MAVAGDVVALRRCELDRLYAEERILAELDRQRLTTVRAGTPATHRGRREDTRRC